MKDETARRREQLSPAKQELLRRRLRGELGPIGRAAAIPRRAVQTPAPLSFAQQRLWFLDQLQPGSPFYNIPEAVHITGPLDTGVLQRCLAEVVRRHEILRTTFGLVDGQPVQVISPEVRADLAVIDLESIPGEQRRAELSRQLIEEAQRPFDLAQGPLLRATLLRLEEAAHVLLLVTHHSIADGWSMGIFVREVAALYEPLAAGQPSPLPELPIQYADFAIWQQEWLRGERLRQQLAYWKERLAGCPAILELPTDKPRPSVLQSWGARCPVTLSRPLKEALDALSQREGVTLFMTLLAAFQVLLAHYSGQTDISVGSPIANRTRPEIEGLIGFFVNTLVLRTEVSGALTFRDLLHQVRKTTLDAYAHQDLPFEKLVEEIQPARTMSHTPLFQVLFVLQNLPAPALGRPDMTIRRMLVDSGTAKFDLMLELYEVEEGLSGSIEYSTSLFEQATVARMARHYEALLSGAVANPDRRCLELSIVPDEERRLIAAWNATRSEYPAACVHELFEAQAARTPDAVAVIFEASSLTYRELSQRSDELASYLQDLGVGPEVSVGICLERSLELIVVVLAVLKAGGAYVPLDVGYPAKRLAFMMEDARIAVLLTRRHLLDRLPLQGARVVCLDDVRRPARPLSVRCSADNLAYVMYTSGSTGTPKGVAVPHRAIVRLVMGPNYASFTPEDTFLLLAPTAFDASTLEIWGPLLNGGKLAIFPPHPPTLEEIADVVRREQVTTLWLTSGLFHQMVESHLSSLAGVRQLLSGGDVLSVPHVQRVLEELPGCTLINGYGPTENTTFSTCYRMRGRESFSRSVPIGRPISATQAHVLNSRLEPAPIGVPGELYLGGDGLARGYLNRPALTAEKFIPSPLGARPGERLYRTGDLARYLPNGDIEFLGRADHQVKIRGFRIELGEIEAALASLPQVRECVALVREDVPGDKRLVAYVVYHPGQELDTGAVRAALSDGLPDHMVPSAFVVLEALPLTENGKVDRRALPAPDRATTGAAVPLVLPRTPIEEQLVALWSEVLNVSQVGIHDNFFDLGGHSLLATQLVSRIQSAFHVSLSLRSLFGTPTVAGIGQEIERQQASGGAAVRSAITPVSREARRMKLSSVMSSKGSRTARDGQ